MTVQCSALRIRLELTRIRPSRKKPGSGSCVIKFILNFFLLILRSKVWCYRAFEFLTFRPDSDSFFLSTSRIRNPVISVTWNGCNHIAKLKNGTLKSILDHRILFRCRIYQKNFSWSVLFLVIFFLDSNYIFKACHKVLWLVLIYATDIIIPSWLYFNPLTYGRFSDLYFKKGSKTKILIFSEGHLQQKFWKVKNDQVWVVLRYFE